MVNTNKIRSSDPHLVNISLEDEMKAYDNLPSELRKRLRELPHRFSAVRLQQVLDGTIPVHNVRDEILEILRGFLPDQK